MRPYPPFGVGLIALILVVFPTVVVLYSILELTSLRVPSHEEMAFAAAVGIPSHNFSAIQTAQNVLTFNLLFYSAIIVIGIGLFNLRKWSRYLAIGWAGLSALLMLVQNFSATFTGGDLLFLLFFVGVFVYLIQPGVQQAFEQANPKVQQQPEQANSVGSEHEDEDDEDAEFVPPEALGLTPKRVIL